MKKGSEVMKLTVFDFFIHLFHKGLNENVIRAMEEHLKVIEHIRRPNKPLVDIFREIAEASR